MSQRDKVGECVSKTQQGLQRTLCLGEGVGGGRTLLEVGCVKPTEGEN